MTIAAAKSVLIVFCKAPVPGEVKTRLAESVGNMLAAELHRELAMHTLDKVTGKTGLEVQLWCSPSTDHSFFQECAQKYGVTLKSQVDGDLGYRMLNAFQNVLAESPGAVIIGTDCPALDVSYIHRANEFLQHDHEAVIGPAEDGGYVLLGLRDVKASYFQGIQWGTDAVLRKSLCKLPDATGLLPTLWDIDNAKDLTRLSECRDILALPSSLADLLDEVESSTNCL